MEIYKGIDIVDIGLYVKKEKMLVLADFHVGFEEALNKHGVMIPRFQFKDMVLRLDGIFSKVKPSTIVINGDVKHEFGKISNQEWRDALKLIDYLSRRCDKLLLVKGNHDKSLGPIADKRNIDVVDEVRLDGLLIVHGHKIPKKLEKVVLIGHEHPAVVLEDNGRKEKYKCFLRGKYKSSVLIVQPSFNMVTEGTNVLKESLLSPFLKRDISSFECWISSEGKVFHFGKLKNLA